MQKVFVDVGINSCGCLVKVECLLDAFRFIGPCLSGCNGGEDRGNVEDGACLLERERELGSGPLRECVVPMARKAADPS